MRWLRALFLPALLLMLFTPATALSTDNGASLKYGGGGGLGTVIFDGRKHVGKGYACKDCHLDLFATKKQARISMADHFTDKYCFRCHNNDKASRDCVSCHRHVPASGFISSAYMPALMNRPVRDEAERDALLTGRSGASEQTRACLSCHGSPDLKPETERGKTLNLHVDRAAYGIGAHRSLPCTACHIGLDGEKSFLTRPHALNHPAAVDCRICHADRLAKDVASFRESAHMQKTEGRFACVYCHDAHSQQPKDAALPYEERVRRYNQACLGCHANPGRFSQLSKTPLNLEGMKHAFMTRFDAHGATILCADCHSPVGPGGMGIEPHRILGREQALRNCAACHADMDSLIVARLKQSDGSTGVLNGKYVPGSRSFAAVEQTGLWALAILLCGILLHAAGRLSGRRAEGALHSEPVYPLPVRVFHWVNAGCFVLLLWTGCAIHVSGVAPGLEFAARLHNITGCILAVNFLAFLAFGLISGDIRQYIPSPRGLGARLGLQIRYYLYGMFRGEPKPFETTRASRFNPLQQMTYLVFFVLGMPVLLFSGILLLLPEATTAGIAPRETLACIHFTLAVLYGLFLVLHLYLTTTGATPFSLIRGMFTGRHESRVKEKG